MLSQGCICGLVSIALLACGSSTSDSVSNGSSASAGVGGQDVGGSGAGGVVDCVPSATVSYDNGLTELAIENPSCAEGALHALQDCGRFGCEPSPLFRLEMQIDGNWQQKDGSGCSCLPEEPARLAPGETRAWQSATQIYESGTYRWILAVSWDTPQCAPEPWNCFQHAWEEIVSAPFMAP